MLGCFGYSYPTYSKTSSLPNCKKAHGQHRSPSNNDFARAAKRAAPTSRDALIANQTRRFSWLVANLPLALTLVKFFIVGDTLLSTQSISVRISTLTDFCKITHGPSVTFSPWSIGAFSPQSFSSASRGGIRAYANGEPFFPLHRIFHYALHHQ